MNDASHSSTGTARAGFKPNAMRVARFLLASKADSLIELLDEVGNAMPDLSYHDFWGGFILADILIHSPQQIRPVAPGLPEVGTDLIRWLDEVIALAAPADKWGRA